MIKLCLIVRHFNLLVIFSYLLLLASISVISNPQVNYRKSPENYGLIPESSDTAVPELIEMQDSRLDPEPNDINTTVLSMRLGKDLDLDYVNVAKPKSYHKQHFPFRRNRKGRLVPLGPMPEHVKELDLRWLPWGSDNLRTRVSPKLSKKLRQMVWALTSCPVSSTWRDLGPRWWPRWLRLGSCPQARSCSLPPGMTCRPSATKHKTLLRWHCPSISLKYNSSAAAHHKPCAWIKVHYPVVTECSCSCPHKRRHREDNSI